jgi:hypothetical protein
VIQYYDPLFWLADRLFGWSRLPVLFSAVSPRRPGFSPGPGGWSGVHLLPNAVDPSAWRRPQETRTRRRSGIVAVMRLSVRKRGQALIRLLPGFWPACPGAGACASPSWATATSGLA